MDQWALIVSLIVGAIVGWLAARVLKRTWLGEVGDIVVGMAGGFVGSWVWGSWVSGSLHPPAESFDMTHTIAAAAAGSLVLLILWRVVRR
jgi:uncharacterized membrane protein YeaQ/YmgE (transglycosylase-associated protein family)